MTCSNINTIITAPPSDLVFTDTLGLVDLLGHSRLEKGNLQPVIGRIQAWSKQDVTSLMLFSVNPLYGGAWGSQAQSHERYMLQSNTMFAMCYSWATGMRLTAVTTVAFENWIGHLWSVEQNHKNCFHLLKKAVIFQRN